jgi:hypothetical protein
VVDVVVEDVVDHVVDVVDVVVVGIHIQLIINPA